MQPMAKKTKLVKPGRAYDTEMIRDFLEHLLWELRIKAYESSPTGIDKTNPEDMLRKYAQKYPGSPAISSATMVDTNDDWAELHKTLAAAYREWTDKLEALMPLLLDAVEWARVGQPPYAHARFWPKHLMEATSDMTVSDAQDCLLAKVPASLVVDANGRVPVAILMDAMMGNWAERNAPIIDMIREAQIVLAFNPDGTPAYVIYGKDKLDSYNHEVPEEVNVLEFVVDQRTDGPEILSAAVDVIKRHDA